MSEQMNEHYQKACEFTFPIKLNIPITVNPQVSVTPANSSQQKLPIYLEPDILLEPEVKAKESICYPVSDYKYDSHSAE